MQLKRTLGSSAAGRHARACVAGTLLFSAAAAGAQVSNGVPTGPPSPAAPAPAAAPAAPQQTQGTPAAPANPNAAGTPAGSTPAVNLAKAKPEPTVPPLKANLGEFAGKVVENIQYEGVDFDKSDKLLSELSQKAGQPFDPEKVRQTTRRLFQTGRYRNIAVRVEPAGANGLTLIFSGIARYYVGRVQINGIQEDRLTSLVEYGTQLNPGTAYTNSMVTTATGLVKQVLAQAGYYEPTIAVKTDRDDAGQQVNVTYTIDVGKQARVGTVTLIGKDPGITEAQFRKKGKLKPKTRVGRETTSTALGNMRTFFQKKDRLEATVTLQKSTYDPVTKTVNYAFNVDQGPIVLVKTEGYKFSKSRLHLLVPVYEEGAVDIDLLNEGRFNIHDFLQQEGYFDATVNVAQVGQGQAAPDTNRPDTFTISQPGGAVPRTTLPPPPPPPPNEFKPVNGTETVLYTIDKGEKHKVESVKVVGSKYFSPALLEDGLSVKKGDAYQRSGRYSAQLVIADQNKIKSLYRANGFNDAQVTSSVKDAETGKNGKPAKVGEISVTYTVVEGAQQQFGTVAITGADAERIAKLRPLLQATPGQPFSLVTLSGDRDELRSYYVANGFDQARVEVAQVIDPADKTKTNVAYNVTEGEQVFIGRVLESGVEHTRQALVNAQTEVAAGQPLDQSALLNTQRKLYDLALFNEVVAAVQNPTGDAELKNVLIQITEAKRWDVTYGFGFEAQTGTPTCTTCTQQGTTKAQEGQAGVSPRVTLDISRINLLGTQDSLALHTTYGLLERVATLTFTNPHLYGSPIFSLQTSGGYSNVQDITTFKSSTLQGDVRVTHKATRKDTFIYNFVYRRVSVDPNSLAISANLIPILSEPVRVAGPGITWFHDTRSPSPLDAVKGEYTSVQQFLATSKVGSQTDFSRTDVSNSTYYQFGKKKYVFARNTRFGFIYNYGINPNTTMANGQPQVNAACAGTLLDTNASCNPTPLPERLYAGGATSHRGFPINGAGPRDLQTGFPVGGSSVFVNTFELRLPAPTLPIVGDSVSFVLFHDMGNVFYHVGDTFKSIKNFHQPNQSTCTNTPNNTGTATPLVAFGTCNFNYFSHAVGLGARYKTPVGPIRVDFAYNLNPPVYPVIPTITGNTYFQNQVPTSNTGSHFQFFFSIGQSF